MAPTRSSCLRFRKRYSLAVLACAAILLTYLSFGSNSGGLGGWRSRITALPYPNTDTSTRTDNNDDSAAHAPVEHPAPPTPPEAQAPTPPNPSANANAETAGEGLRHTTIPSGAHIHGFTVLDNLYLRNGTFYVVAPDKDRAALPPRDRLLSLPVNLIAWKDMQATDEQLRFITPDEAADVLGSCITRIEGFSVIVYDPAQYVGHFYHWFGEIILGAWRVYSHILLDQDRAGAQKALPLPLPSRFILPFIATDGWRDKAGLDGPFMRAAFPGAPIECAGYWRDLAALGTTVVFERAMVINRAVAHRHPNGGVWYKMIAGAMNVSAPKDFWAPVREELWRNTLGVGAVSPGHGAVEVEDAIPLPEGVQSEPADKPSALPRVTYISRQGSGRRLIEADHLALIDALRALEEEGVCEVKVVQMEKMETGLRGQVELVKGSTILVGVHGNGLTHQIWMPPSRLSTTIEILIPNGYVFDYEILARNMGHRHYAVWNDTFVTFPEGQYHKGVKYPDGFHGSGIPVHGPTVAGIIRARLAEGGS
ncbi:hypothetical protein B0H19DRAFT_988134 [Mycena capillaripes]|nr:hypothetical protein B0H19DRAFT_988134 [Mycena capillaripes]